MIVALLKATTPNIPTIYKLIDACSRYKNVGGYGHAELLLDNGQSLSAHTDIGVAVRPLYTVYPSEAWDLISVPSGSHQIEEWMQPELECKYDYCGVMRFVLPFMQQSKEKWFCSEIVTAALQQNGMFPDVNAWKVSPNKLAKMLRDLH